MKAGDQDLSYLQGSEREIMKKDFFFQKERREKEGSVKIGEGP